MSVSDSITVIAPWAVAVTFFLLTVRLRIKDAPDCSVYGTWAIAAIMLAAVVSIPAWRHPLLPYLTPMILWLTAVIIGVLCFACFWLFDKTPWVVLDCLTFLGFFFLLPLAIDAGAIALSRWLVVDIGMRITDWGLVASPLVLFVTALLLVVTILNLRSKPLWEDHDFLFKLAALVGSLFCLVLVLDMHLHRPMIVEFIFDSPHVWWLFATCASEVTFAYLIYRLKFFRPIEENGVYAALLAGFSLPGALNALMIGFYYMNRLRV